MHLQRVFFLIVLIYVLDQVTGSSLRKFPKETNLQYDFNVDGKAKHENVELNREENYVRIYVPPTGDADEMTVIHDYNKGVTVCKMGGHCFLLSEFNGFSADIEDWQNTINTEPFEPEEATKLNYKMAPYNLNRTTLPPVMQHQCSDVHMTVPRKSTDTDDDTNDDVPTMYNGTFILPGKSAETGNTEMRVKRGILAAAWTVVNIALNVGQVLSWFG